TLIERYGVDNPMKSHEIAKKAKDTNLKRYGVESVSQLQTVKDKVKKTNNERYGVDSFLCFEHIRKKGKSAFLEKYGFENPFQCPSIKKKAMESISLNGSAPCSKQQRYIHECIGGELNYPCGNLFLDIAFLESMVY